MRSRKRGARALVDGGAWDIPGPMHQDNVGSCRDTAGVGWEVLAGGGSAIDAVEAAVRTPLDEPTFDAELGSVLNPGGEFGLDAIAMDGHNLDLGAVMAGKRVRHPITLARLVMTHPEHSVLVSRGAEACAVDHGLPLCPDRDLLVPRERERYWAAGRLGAHASLSPDTAESQSAARRREPLGDTVGAVAPDADGHLAAATSIRGKFNKHPGRVGDSPLVGSGAYADDRAGAVSSTGEGEALMKIVFSKSTGGRGHRSRHAFSRLRSSHDCMGESPVGCRLSAASKSEPHLTAP